MDESCQDLVVAKAARVRNILQIVGGSSDGADASTECRGTGRSLSNVDDGSVRDIWSAWNA